MRTIVFVLVLLLTSANVHAEWVNGVEWRELTADELAITKPWGTRPLPPKRYDYFNPKVELEVVPRSEVRKICALHGHNSRHAGITACAIPHDDGWCLIVFPAGHNNPTALLRHEMGHCNGWSRNHSD